MEGLCTVERDARMFDLLSFVTINECVSPMLFNGHIR